MSGASPLKKKEEELTNRQNSILEYSPEHFKSLHIMSCILNAFGMFFILAAHEHYTLDVLVGK